MSQAKAIDDEKQNPWKAAIIQELIVDNILTEELERDPRKALAVAIDWNCKVALDPSVSKDAQDLQQRAIDAALESVRLELKELLDARTADLFSSARSEHRSGEINGLRKAILRLGARIGKNPLVDALEKQMASLLKEGAEAAVIAAERIAELEHMLSEEPHNIPTKYVQHGGVTFALHGSSSIQAYEELERELAEVRKEAEAQAKEFAHRPGPWHVSEYTDGRDALVYDKDGFEVARVCYLNRDADAKLIAAAPGLLAAARAALHYMRLHKYADQAWADDLEAAIAAAVTPNDSN